MKQYTKPLPKTRTYRHKSDCLLGIRNGKAAKRGTAGGFTYADSTKPHVLTSITHEMLDNLLENSYKEWTKWLNDYEFRSSQRTMNKPYTPTEFN